MVIQTASPRALASTILSFEALKPDVGVEHHALLQVLAYKDATFGVVAGVASMDADAAEHGDTKEDG